MNVPHLAADPTARAAARIDAAEFIAQGGNRANYGDWDSEAFALTRFWRLRGAAYQAAWRAYRAEFAAACA